MSQAVPSTSVQNHSPILRFGISINGKRSPYWQVRAGVNLPELFLERENPEKKVHLSLHESGQWHLKIKRKEQERWSRPPEIIPGLTRAASIVQPVAVARHNGPAPEDIRFVAVTPDADPTTFSVFIEKPGEDKRSWPGKDATGTELIGRIPLAAGAGTCCVVAHQEPLTPGQMTVPAPSAEELEWMTSSAVAGTLVATVVGTLSDGGIALIDLLADSSLLTNAEASQPADEPLSG